MSTIERSPRGRDAVRAALLQAATELFALHGTEGVSVRDVAAHAGVNHGLVHRHFGSKDALVSEGMTDLQARLAAELPSGDAPLADLLREAFEATRRHRACTSECARAHS